MIRIALIGSRELEQKPEYQKDIKLCYKVCYRLAELGVTMTSGLCALGMDGIAQKAYSQAILDGKAVLEQMEVYVKDEYEIKRSPLPNKHVARVRNPELIQATLELASSVHPAWHRCNEWARGMHSRNCHQVLGYDLQSPVDAVITWTPNGNIQGGTSTALRLAIKNGIPVFNLGVYDKTMVLAAIKELLLLKGVIHSAKALPPVYCLR